MNLTGQAIQKAMARKGYRFFQEGDYNLNLVGIRAASQRAGAFDDQLAVSFQAAGNTVCLVFPATTDPGKKYLRDPINPAGAAILVPGQYVGMWQLGLHRGQYEALVQRRPVKVYRDNDRDDELDHGATETGLFGINCHRASEYHITGDVGAWSAGCQVLQRHDDFGILMALCKRAAAAWGNLFTYTLLEEGDL